MSEDEFDAYDFSEFTEQDLRELDALLARAHPRPRVQIATQDSPFSSFLSWKKHLAVTDLVSPVWCEIQYEYSLYGKRNRPLHLRPPVFTSKSGKQIRVHQQVARANDRRLRRGKLIHKALEDELHPAKRIVHVTSDEERFGLRLIQLIDGFTQLISNGITRELPVFTITHAQVVSGIIDEVRYLPVTQAAQDQAIPSEPPSTSCASPPYEKQQIPSRFQTEDPFHIAPTSIPDHLHELHIIDYKTRRSPSIPVDEDSLSPRLQLMLYHRMLSSLLSPETFDFDLLWNRMNLDPMKPLSAQFLNDIAWEQRQTGPMDSSVHLNRLVSEWKSTVQQNRFGILGVSRQLQLIYRRSQYAGSLEKRKEKTTEIADIEDPLETLLLQEEFDLACAIEKSLAEIGHQEVCQVAQNIRQIGPTSAVWKDLISPSDSEQTDTALAWAIQQSLLTCAHNARAQAPAGSLQPTTSNRYIPVSGDTTSTPKEQVRDGTTTDIIGTREFGMNDAELDTHLTDVLQWWLGARSARGVNIDQTNRCFTCEFQYSCEWREQKAKEAAALVSQRKVATG